MHNDDWLLYQSMSQQILQLCILQIDWNSYQVEIELTALEANH